MKNRWIKLGTHIFVDSLSSAGRGVRQRVDREWEDVFLMLERLYNGEHRFYHNLEHLEYCLRLFDSLNDNNRDLVQSPLSLELAIWFHDAVYTPGSSTNEEESAVLAGETLAGFGLSEKTVSETVELVLCTDYSAQLSVKPPDCSNMRDIDLSILGTPWSTYREYTEKIRREYSVYPESEYRERRKEVLRSFLEKKRLFETEYFYAGFEKQARENIQREISELEQLR